MRKLFFAAAVFAAVFVARAADGYVAFSGEKSSWRDGFDRFDYEMDEGTFAITPFKRPDNEKFAVGAPAKGKRRCVVVVPKAAAAGNPWSWQGCYWDHEPQTEVELLRRGFHIVFVTPDPGKEWDAWYKYLVEEHGLSKKPAFVGMSKGGVNEYDWATANPDKVSCIYADNPAIRPGAFAKLGELAKNDVALLNVCGSFDFLLERHTLPIEARYRELGGRITVVVKDGTAHHPHSLRNPKLIADWMVEHLLPAAPRDKPGFVDEKFERSYFYSLASTNFFLKEEKIFANGRGPGFVECYDRYDLRAQSQWGLGGMMVIVPKKAAAGKPWVMRGNPISRDAKLDLELLAKGFHIVSPPLTAQAGPQTNQWDETYKMMVSDGFAKKVVLEGERTGAGEAYAWAISNPDKVACIVGEDPVLRSLVTKGSLVDRLDVLAKAGVPLLHLCGANSPWLMENTLAIEEDYQKAGGKIKIILDDAEEALDFVLGSVKR